MIDRIRLQKVFDDLPHKTLAVVGDLFLDQYLQLDSTLTETSIETGLSAYQVTAINPVSYTHLTLPTILLV